MCFRRRAYTLAIILTEILGEAAFRQRVKIYATDVDEEALEQARHYGYRAQDLESIPEELQARYFDAGGQYADLRRSVIFGRHDLVQDAPISRLDLLVCRNTLIYLNTETQTKILRRFHFALNDTGVLFLGKAEMLLSHADLFTPISLTHRIFRQVSRSNGREFLLELPRTSQTARKTLESCLRLQELGFDAVPSAHLIIDFSGKLVLANTLAQTMFSITAMDLGRLLQDLEISYRPLELRSCIEQVYQQHRLVLVQNVIWDVPGKSRQYVDVQINPLEEENGEILGISVFFIESAAPTNFKRSFSTLTRNWKLRMRNYNRPMKS